MIKLLTEYKCNRDCPKYIKKPCSPEVEAEGEPCIDPPFHPRVTHLNSKWGGVDKSVEDRIHATRVSRR